MIGIEITVDLVADMTGNVKKQIFFPRDFYINFLRVLLRLYSGSFVFYVYFRRGLGGGAMRSRDNRDNDRRRPY